MKKNKLIKGFTLLSIVVGVYASNAIIDKTARTIMYRSKKDQLDYSTFINTYDAKEVSIKNQKNITNHAFLIEKKNAKSTIIICHPFGHEAVEMEMYVTYFDKKLKNCNILLINATSHGKSEGYIRGLGIHDVLDLKLWNDYVIKQYGEQHSILFYGKEMGANTIINASSLQMLHHVKGIISDGAYTNPLDLLNERLNNEYHFPKGVPIQLIRRKIKKDIGIDINYSTVDLCSDNTVPILFFHSLQDEFVSIEHVYPLYNACGGDKELFVVKDEQYLCHVSETDEYKETLSRFIKKVL